MQDGFKVEILPDGRVKTTSGKFSATVHQSADAFLKSLAAKTDGNTERSKRTDKHAQAHQHGTDHAHEGE